MTQEQLDKHVGPVREEVLVMVKHSEAGWTFGPYTLVCVELEYGERVFHCWDGKELDEFKSAKIYTPPKNRPMTAFEYAKVQGIEWIYKDSDSGAWGEDVWKDIDQKANLQEAETEEDLNWIPLGEVEDE